MTQQLRYNKGPRNFQENRDTFSKELELSTKESLLNNGISRIQFNDGKKRNHTFCIFIFLALIFTCFVFSVQYILLNFLLMVPMFILVFGVTFCYALDDICTNIGPYRKENSSKDRVMPLQTFIAISNINALAFGQAFVVTFLVSGDRCKNGRNKFVSYLPSILLGCVWLPILIHMRLVCHIGCKIYRNSKTDRKENFLLVLLCWISIFFQALTFLVETDACYTDKIYLLDVTGPEWPLLCRSMAMVQLALLSLWVLSLPSCLFRWICRTLLFKTGDLSAKMIIADATEEYLNAINPYFEHPMLVYEIVSYLMDDVLNHVQQKKQNFSSNCCDRAHVHFQLDNIEFRRQIRRHIFGKMQKIGVQDKYKFSRSWEDIDFILDVD